MSLASILTGAVIGVMAPSAGELQRTQVDYHSSDDRDSFNNQDTDVQDQAQDRRDSNRNRESRTTQTRNEFRDNRQNRTYQRNTWDLTDVQAGESAYRRTQTDQRIRPGTSVDPTRDRFRSDREADGTGDSDMFWEDRRGNQLDDRGTLAGDRSSINPYRGSRSNARTQVRDRNARRVGDDIRRRDNEMNRTRDWNDRQDLNQWRDRYGEYWSDLHRAQRAERRDEARWMEESGYWRDRFQNTRRPMDSWPDRPADARLDQYWSDRYRDMRARDEALEGWRDRDRFNRYQDGIDPNQPLDDRYDVLNPDWPEHTDDWRDWESSRFQRDWGDDNTGFRRTDRDWRTDDSGFRRTDRDWRTEETGFRRTGRDWRDQYAPGAPPSRFGDDR